MAEPTWADMVREWGGWALGAVLGVKTIMKSRQDALNEAIDARIQSTVNPPLLHEMLVSIKETGEETSEKVNELAERVSRIEGADVPADRRKADPMPLLSVRGGNGNGRVI